MEKRWWFIIPVLVLTIGACAWWVFSRNNSLQPDISITNVEITNIDDEKVSLLTHIILSNNLPGEINTKRLQYKVYIDSTLVLESMYDQPIVMKAAGDTKLEIPVQIPVEKMISVFQRFEQNDADSADYMVRSYLMLDLPGVGERKFTFKIAKRYPAVRMPDVALQKMELNDVKLKGSALDLTIAVHNKNIFPLKLRDGKFAFAVDDKIALDGLLEKEISIPAKGSQIVSVHLNLSTAGLSRLAWKALFDKKDTQFRLKFNGVADADNELLNDTKIIMTVKGTLKELIDAGKKINEQTTASTRRK